MSLKSGMELSVIIVNHNAAIFLEECLASVFDQRGVLFEVLVVDNASQDRSCQIVKEKFPRALLIENKENVGFSCANNQALEKASGDYIYFLNPDTRVHPAAFSHIKSYLNDHEDVGIAGTRIINPDGSPQPSVEKCYPGGRLGERALGDMTGDIAWVLGASMAGRGDLLRDIGGFDERFFLYGEDADICLRIRRGRYRVGFIPEAVVMHRGGESERGYQRVAVWEKKIRAETLFFEKYYSNSMCRRIHREGLLQAYWRLFSIGLSGYFQKDVGEAKREKEVKYRAVTRVYRWNP